MGRWALLRHDRPDNGIDDGRCRHDARAASELALVKPSRTQALAAGQDRSPPAAVKHTGEEAPGNVPIKIDSMLRAGTRVPLVVIMPEKDVSSHCPSFDMPMGAWQKKMASEIMAAWTAMVLRAVGEAPVFSVVNRENISGNRYRDIRTVRLIDMERNTILSLDELVDELAVDTSTQSATVMESRLNGRRDVQDSETRPGTAPSEDRADKQNEGDNQDDDRPEGAEYDDRALLHWVFSSCFSCSFLRRSVSLCTAYRPLRSSKPR